MPATRARWAVTSAFALNGLVIAAMSVRTPSVKIQYGLSTGRLGLTSALFGVAAVAAMQGTGGLAARLGSGRIVRAAVLLLPLALLGVGLAGGFAGLCLVFLALGGLVGMLDVTMNAHAVAVERALGRPIINGCHAAWSIGAMTGALTGGAAAAAGLSLTTHFLIVAAVAIPAAILTTRWLLPPSAEGRTADDAVGESTAERVGFGRGWSRRLVLIGAMGAIVLACEAAVATWSGVFLHDRLHASLGVAALGYIGFMASETTGRLVGDRLFNRYSATTLVRIGTALAAVALAVALGSPWAVLSVAAFAVMGIGLATALPVIFSVVGHLGADGPGAAVLVARFTTMSYSGILLAPAVIGWSAGRFGLGWTLGALAPLLAMVAWQATRLPAPRRTGDVQQDALVSA